jgi:hypothetical protein
VSADKSPLFYQLSRRRNLRKTISETNPIPIKEEAEGSGIAFRFKVVRPPALPTVTLKSPAGVELELGRLEIPDVEILNRLVISVPTTLEKPDMLAAWANT